MKLQTKLTEKTETTFERLTVTVTETAKIIGISERMVYLLTQSGELPCIRIGRRVLYTKDAIHEFIKSRQVTIQATNDFSSSERAAR